MSAFARWARRALAMLLLLALLTACGGQAETEKGTDWSPEQMAAAIWASQEGLPQPVRLHSL